MSSVRFEVIAVVLCYREELSSGCAIMSPSIPSAFISLSFLSNEMENAYTKGLSALLIHDRQPP